MTQKSSKTIGYIRVSTIDQDVTKNRAAILQFSNDKNLGKVHFVEEKVSGKVSWKNRKISDAVNELTTDDNLIVPELSRLGRTMLEIMEILSIAKQKGINIFATKVSQQKTSLITQIN